MAPRKELLLAGELKARGRKLSVRGIHLALCHPGEDASWHKQTGDRF